MSTVRASHGKMVHSMQTYPIQTHSRSEFNRSSSLITAFNSGYLVPIWWRYAYPGDTLKLQIKALARLSAQLTPFMTNILMDIHVWKIPIRLLWPNFLKMQGQQDNPGDSTDYLMPIINSGENGFGFGSIFDHFDYVPGVANYDATSMPLRAYNFTFNWKYRDENLQEMVPMETGDTDSSENYQLLFRGRRKDYFQGMLPWPQKGEDVLLPLGTSAPVTITNSGSPMAFYTDATTDDYANLFTSKPAGASQANSSVSTRTLDGEYYYRRGLSAEADLSQATAATMSQLYMANAVQQILQVDARSGTRYIELILGRWGVMSSDSRLQMPEYIGGCTVDLNTSIVPQTSSTNSTSPQANLAAFSTLSGGSNRIVTSFEEHCICFAVASVRPAEYYYQQGLHRDFTKRSRFDFYEPGLANLPEQTVLNGEIFIQPKTVLGDDGQPVNNGVLGYQERFAEDKTAYSRIHGYMRSTAPQSLDIWHLADDYESLPSLNESFIRERMPLSRVLAVTGNNTPEFIANFRFNEIWIKEMPLYSNPSLMKF